MLSSKTKTGVSESVPNKTTATTPRSSTKLGRGSVITKFNPDSPSPLHNSRLSLDRSARLSDPKPAARLSDPKPAAQLSDPKPPARLPDSKPAVERRSPRTTPKTADKQLPRTATKGSELQAQLSQLQEDLAKSKDTLASVEKDKEKALEELKEAKRLAEEATQKLGEALVAQKRAEETTVIEKFRADELEQAGIEATQKKQDEWQREIDVIRNQHAMDVASLLSTTEELQQIKQELAVTSDAKNQAASHADDATKTAEIHAEKVEFLTLELSRVKASIESNVEMKASESTKLIDALKAEVGFLKQELERAKASETQMGEAESLIEQLKLEVEKAKSAETKVAESEICINRLKQELERAKDAETKTSEAEVVIEQLKQELERAKADETKMAEAEIFIEQLKQELERAKTAETKMVEAETYTEQLKQELQRAKAVETKMVEAETYIEQLKQELESAKNSEIKLVQANSSVEQLKQQLERAKAVETKVSAAENLIEQLRIELATAKKAELDAGILVKEWKIKVEHFESRVHEANHLERSASESLGTLMEQLEGKSGLLEDTEAEVASLREEVESLGMLLGRQRRDLEELKENLQTARREASEKTKKIESLNSEIENLKEERVQALNNEKLAASSVQNLLEEKHKLINDLDSSRHEEDKSKKAMESLASALHEVSSEVREAKEKLLSTQTELENAEAQIDDLKLLLKATNEKYEGMLHEAKHEIKVLTDEKEKSKNEIEKIKATWNQNELNFNSSLKILEEESSFLKTELGRLNILLKEAEEEAQVAKKEGSRLQDTLKEAESEVLLLKGVVGEVKSESMILKERLLDTESDLQNITKENDELRMREATAQEKLSEMSKLQKENGELSGSEKDYDMLPSDVEFSEENGTVSEESKHIVDVPPHQANGPQAEKDLSEDLVASLEPKEENGNANFKQDDGDSTAELEESKMWENCKIGEKDLLSEKEPESESFEEEVDSKADDESFDQLNGSSLTDNNDNGGTFPTKQQLHKKKKPLLQKFGSLLKKGSTKSK